jgi:predicted TIM-barrel fold metal-dependent hydrolase
MIRKTRTNSLVQSGNKLSFGIYDSHTHVWESDSIGTRSPRNSSLTTPGSAESLLKLMDENNVIQSLVITPMTLGFDNSISFDVANRYPDRFLPIVRIDLSNPYFLETFQELCGEGARGLRINLHHLPSADFLSDERYSKLWLYLESASIPLFIHCETLQLPVIKSISSQHERMKIIIDHTGRVKSKDGIASPSFMNLLTLAELPNIYIKISSTNYFAEVAETHADLSDFVSIILQKFSPDRLLWGSDWPFSENDGTYATSLEPLLSMKLTDRENTLKKVLHSNFRELLNV